MTAETPNQDQVMQEEQPVSAEVNEFEIGEHPVPWFLWVFFSLIITWASISWIKFFGY